jgi:hypothetical protein
MRRRAFLGLVRKLVTELPETVSFHLPQKPGANALRLISDSVSKNRVLTHSG